MASAARLTSLHSSQHSRKGFTLVELSIVLVIIGLMIGGIVVGQSLIRSAKLRAVVKEKQGYVAAFNAFRDKYGYLPGDFPKATDVWGAADADPATCTTTAATLTTPYTCNGDGNHTLGGIGQSPATDTDTLYEMFRAWQQLALDGLIEKYPYTGVAASTTIDTPPLQPEESAADSDANVPSSALHKTAAWIAVTAWYLQDSCFYYSTNRSNFLVLAGDPDDDHNVGVTVTSSEYLLGADELRGIDEKTDDGKPHAGHIQTTVNADCSSACTDTEYALTSSKPHCILMVLGEY